MLANHDSAYLATEQEIQELFAKERQWMTAQMQMYIREVNSMFADERLMTLLIFPFYKLSIYLSLHIFTLLDT